MRVWVGSYKYIIFLYFEYPIFFLIWKKYFKKYWKKPKSQLFSYFNSTKNFKTSTISHEKVKQKPKQMGRMLKVYFFSIKSKKNKNKGHLYKFTRNCQY